MVYNSFIKSVAFRLAEQLSVNFHVIGKYPAIDVQHMLLQYIRAN